jgi:hypothetical protein
MHFLLLVIKSFIISTNITRSPSTPTTTRPAHLPLALRFTLPRATLIIIRTETKVLPASLMWLHKTILEAGPIMNPMLTQMQLAAISLRVAARITSFLDAAVSPITVVIHLAGVGVRRREKFKRRDVLFHGFGLGGSRDSEDLSARGRGVGNWFSFVLWNFHGALFA